MQKILNSYSGKLQGRLVKLVTAGLLLLISLAAWAFSSPPGSSPDENFHLGSIWCNQNFDQESCKTISKDRSAQSLDVLTPHLMDVCFIFYSNQSAKCDWDSRSKNPTLLANNGLYPNGEYEFLHQFISPSPAISVLAMRLINSLIFIVFLILAIALSRPSDAFAVFIASAISIIPLGIFIIPSINPSGWAYTAAATNWIFLSNVIKNAHTGRKNWAINLALFLATAYLAFASRWDVMVFIFLSGTAVLIRNWKALLKMKRLVIAIVLLTLSTLAYFSMHNRVGAGSTNLTGLGGGNPELGLTYLLRVNLENFITLYAGNVGYNWGIGWLDTHLPEVVGIIGIMIWGMWLSKIFPQKNISNYLASSFIIFCGIFIPVYVLVSEKLLVGQQVQPRYILPLLPIVFGILLSGAKASNTSLASLKSLTYLTVILISFINFLSLHTNLRRYITGTDVSDFNLNRNIEWWWGSFVSPNFVLVSGSLAFLAAMYLISNHILSGLESRETNLDASNTPRII